MRDFAMNYIPDMTELYPEGMRPLCEEFKSKGEQPMKWIMTASSLVMPCLEYKVINAFDFDEAYGKAISISQKSPTMDSGTFDVEIWSPEREEELATIQRQQCEDDDDNYLPFC